MFVEAFVAELSVGAFDVPVLHGAARLNQQMLDAMSLRPGDESPTGELRTVVGSHSTRVPAKAGGLVKYTHYVGAADAVIDSNVDAFVAEVIGDRQARITSQPLTMDRSTADPRVKNLRPISAESEPAPYPGFLNSLQAAC